MVRIILFAFMLGSLGWQLASASDEIPESMLETIEKLVPGMKPDQISVSPVPGLYEVTFGPRVVYLTGDGRYMVRGDLVDLNNQRNLTEETRKAARLETVNDLGESSMIVFAPETVKHTITVFTDVDCPYCSKLHLDVPELNEQGVKVRYLAFPRTGIQSPSYHKTVSVWCADDPHEAITDAKAGRDVTPVQCENPVENHFETGQMLGVSGTPTIVFEDGTLVPGYIPAARLVKMLDDEQAG
jgi:thiol:disulfide interchange protein DsbC